MKKVLLIIAFLVSVSFLQAQITTATLSLPNLEVTADPGTVVIPIELTEKSAGDLIVGIQISFYFDETYLHWMGTTTNATAGVNAINPNLTPLGGDWLWNYNNPGNLIFSWIDPTFMGVLIEPVPQNLIDLNFSYLGGLLEGQSTPLTFSLTYKVVNGQNAKIINELTNQNIEVYVLDLIDGSVAYPSIGPTVLDWEGDISADWFDGNNWAGGVVPTMADDATVNTMVTYWPVITGGNAAVNNLGIMGQVTVAPGAGLTTYGDLTNDGMFAIESDNGLGYAGSYINMGAIGGTGMFYFNRNVICTGTQAGTGNPFGWHYLAAPFDGFTTDMLPDYFVNAWDQASGMWIQYAMDPYTNPCTPWPTTPLNTLDAWSINMDMDYPSPLCPGSPAGTGVQVEFMGGAAGVHTGAYAKGLGYGAGAYQEWNMVSNPYPSGLDVNTIAWGPNTVQATYFYDGCGGNYVYWAAGLGSYVMAPTLGFMVETTGADVFAVDNMSRAHNADWFWKGEVANLLTLQASGNDRTDLLYVRFANDVTPGFDNNGDAHKLFAQTEGLPQIYTVAGNEMLAINALPETPSVPMGFKANGNGTYTIEAIETSDFENVVLEDLFTLEQIDLLTSSYTFNYNVEDNADRFVIHFTPLGTSELNANNVSIWAADQTIFVNTSATNGDIVVYNMMGQVVAKTTIVPGVNEIPMSEVNTYYIVKVLGSEVTETGKVFIK